MTPDGAKTSEVFLCQIGCILAIHKDSSCVAMYIISLWLEELHATNGPRMGALTPRSFRYLKYQGNINNQVHRQLIPVEHIKHPACVIPTNCSSEALHLNTYGKLKASTLLSIDFNFFTRQVVEQSI